MCKKYTLQPDLLKYSLDMNFYNVSRVPLWLLFMSLFFINQSFAMADITLNQIYKTDGSIEINGAIKLSPLLAMFQGMTATDKDGNKISPLEDICGTLSDSLMKSSGSNPFIVIDAAAKNSWKCEQKNNKNYTISMQTQVPEAQYQASASQITIGSNNSYESPTQVETNDAKSMLAQLKQLRDFGGTIQVISSFPGTVKSSSIGTISDNQVTINILKETDIPFEETPLIELINKFKTIQVVVDLPSEKKSAERTNPNPEPKKTKQSIAERIKMVTDMFRSRWSGFFR